MGRNRNDLLTATPEVDTSVAADDIYLELFDRLGRIEAALLFLGINVNDEAFTEYGMTYGLTTTRN